MRHLSPSNFNSLAPCGANPIKGIAFFIVVIFQLTRPVRSEPGKVTCRFLYGDISTHSPRAGRTARTRRKDGRKTHFNSLAPCGANPLSDINKTSGKLFQLTRPVRGEPPFLFFQPLVLVFFNSLAPCGANPPRSSRLPRSRTFQLTRPVRGEPSEYDLLTDYQGISTHSPRAGRTRDKKQDERKDGEFQLTRPVRGEPNKAGDLCAEIVISTHSPRAGRTRPLARRLS